jgi:5-formyltetrahydrofolate cyclo-ligase
VNALSTRPPLSKQGWRSEFKSRLHGALGQGGKPDWDRAIAIFVRDLLPPQGGIVAAYMARADEPDVVTHLSAHDPQWQWAFPRVEGESLKYYIPNSPMALKPGAYGLVEPDPALAKPVTMAQIHVVLIPGLGFDRKGTRIGRGQGFYDRALQDYSGLKVGLGYSVQLANESFARESHDIPMDVVVTEKFLLRLKG